jgi:hypothetical protein
LALDVSMLAARAPLDRHVHDRAEQMMHRQLSEETSFRIDSSHGFIVKAASLAL